MTGDEHSPGEPGDRLLSRPFTHRRPMMLVLVLVLVVLQIACAAIIAFQASRLMDLGQRIEQLEQDKTLKSKPNAETK